MCSMYSVSDNLEERNEWIREQLRLIAECIAPTRENVEKYRRIFNFILSGTEEEICTGLQIFIDAIILQHISIITARQVLTDVCRAVAFMPDRLSKRLSLYTLERTDRRVMLFEEQATALRQHLADIYERQEEWLNAATTLCSIPLETGQRTYTIDYKLEVYLKITRYYLEADQPDSAEWYINRASVLQMAAKDKSMQVFYKAYLARMLEVRGRYMEAAQRYVELSNIVVVPDLQRMAALRNALVCTVLAPAGEQRSRMFAVLYTDERSDRLPAFTILEKMYYERVITRDDFDELIALMQHHHMVRTVDGVQCVDRAFIEHNLLALSQLYKNITFETLSHVLNLDATYIESISAQMIRQDRLDARIDQPAGILFYKCDRQLPTWNVQIKGICQQMDHLVAVMRKTYPDRKLDTIEIDSE